VMRTAERETVVMVVLRLFHSDEWDSARDQGHCHGTYSPPEETSTVTSLRSAQSRHQSLPSLAQETSAQTYAGRRTMRRNVLNELCHRHMKSRATCSSRVDFYARRLHSYQNEVAMAPHHRHRHGVDRGPTHDQRRDQPPISHHY